MTCGLFLILHHVLCVLAIDPGTSTECTETWIPSESDRYKSNGAELLDRFRPLYFRNKREHNIVKERDINRTQAKTLDNRIHQVYQDRLELREEGIGKAIRARSRISII